MAPTKMVNPSYHSLGAKRFHQSIRGFERNIELEHMRAKFQKTNDKLKVLTPQNQPYRVYVFTFPVSGKEHKGSASNDAQVIYSFFIRYEAVTEQPDPQVFLTGGQLNDHVDISHSGLKAILTHYQTIFSIPELRRSGRGYQLCYLLKGLRLNTNWDIKPAVIYHRFDVEFATQIWILVDPDQDFRKAIGQADQIPIAKYTDSVSHQFISLLQGHIFYARWATRDWEEHIETMEADLRRQVQTKDHTADIIQDTIHITFTLKQNINNLTNLVNFYKTLIFDPRVSSIFKDGHLEMMQFVDTDFSKDVQNYIFQNTNLRDRGMGASYVSLYSVTWHNNYHAKDPP
ncbi:hypothetical protein QBC38DRAFT_461633, partial [Podospora fimiseda]